LEFGSQGINLCNELVEGSQILCRLYLKEFQKSRGVLSPDLTYKKDIEMEIEENKKNRDFSGERPYEILDKSSDLPLPKKREKIERSQVYTGEKSQ
jgi:hypothetical protein